jgi:hypothetical protein
MKSRKTIQKEYESNPPTWWNKQGSEMSLDEVKEYADFVGKILTAPEVDSTSDN